MSGSPAGTIDAGGLADALVDLKQLAGATERGRKVVALFAFACAAQLPPGRVALALYGSAQQLGLVDPTDHAERDALLTGWVSACSAKREGAGSKPGSCLAKTNSERVPV